MKYILSKYYRESKIGNGYRYRYINGEDNTSGSFAARLLPTYLAMGYVFAKNYKEYDIRWKEIKE